MTEKHLFLLSCTVRLIHVKWLESVPVCNGRKENAVHYTHTHTHTHTHTVSQSYSYINSMSDFKSLVHLAWFQWSCGCLSASIGFMYVVCCVYCHWGIYVPVNMCSETCVAINKKHCLYICSVTAVYIMKCTTSLLLNSLMLKAGTENSGSIVDIANTVAVQSCSYLVWSTVKWVRVQENACLHKDMNID